MAFPVGWGFYKTHTITDSIDGALTNWTLDIIVNKGAGTDTGNEVFLGANVNDDFSDVRFTDDAGNLLGYWRQTYTSATKAKFRILHPSITGNPVMRIYYGNASATYDGDINTAFLFGDDFERYHKGFTFKDGAGQWYIQDGAKIGNDIYYTLEGASTDALELWKSTDHGYTWSKVSDIVAGSSSRTHIYLASDGVNTLIATYTNTANTEVYSKTSTDSGATWGTEKTVASGMTAAIDADVMFRTGQTWLCFFRRTTGGNFEILCYESTDDGATWASKSTVVGSLATATYNSVEDIDAIVAPNGDILCGWELETTEAGEAQCNMRISTDNGATWGSTIVVVNNGVGIDDEGGNFVIAPNGTDIHYVYGSNKAGGTSYFKGQIYRLTSSDNGATWGSEVLLYDAYCNIEPVPFYNANGHMVVSKFVQYVSGGVAANNSVAVIVLDGDDLSDGGWIQSGGIAYASSRASETKRAMRVESWMPVATTERGFLLQNTYTPPNDYVLETLCMSPGTEVDVRLVWRWTDINNHYMAGLLKSGATEQINTFERAAGTYTALETDVVTFAPDTAYLFAVDIEGTAFRTFTGTDPYAALTARGTTASDASNASGKFALAVGNATGRHAAMFYWVGVRTRSDNAPAHSTWGAEVAIEASSSSLSVKRRRGRR